MFDRREVMAGALAAGLTGEPKTMYGLHGKMTCAPGTRDKVVAILMGGMDVLRSFPGCRIYLLGTDPASPDDIWITEVWDDKAAHDASLKTPEVQAEIAQARGMIVGGTQQVTTVLGGVGLPK